MAIRGSRGAQRTRTDAERARLYEARRQWHHKHRTRRRRDTVISVIAGGLIVIGAVVSQTLHAQVTAPTPAPVDTATPSAPSETPGPVETSTVPAPTPLPTQTPGE